MLEVACSVARNGFGDTWQVCIHGSPLQPRHHHDSWTNWFGIGKKSGKNLKSPWNWIWALSENCRRNCFKWETNNRETFPRNWPYISDKHI